MRHQELYRQAMATRVAALETAVAALRDGAGEAAASLARIAHALRGSGGTYGFPEISAAAAALEAEASREHATQSSIIGAALALVDEMRRVLLTTPEPTIEILLIDDAADIALIVRALLAAPTRTITVATTWSEGRRILADREIALVLLDLVLPDADGRNALIALREDPRTAAIPVFVVSGRVGPQPRSECLALGADCYFEKPFDLDVLLAEAMRYVGARQYPSSASRIDEETGLLNRAGLRDAYDRVWGNQRNRGATVAVIGLSGVDTRAANGALPTLIAALQTMDSAGGALIGRWEPDTIAAVVGVSERAVVDALEPMLRRPELARCAAGLIAVRPGADLTDAVTSAQRLRLLAEASGAPRVLWSSSPRAKAAQRTRVLVAEDDPLIAALVKHRLERDGIEVVHHDTGTAGLAAAIEDAARPTSERFACIVLDVKLPGLDGFAVLERLRATTATVPVVMLTSMGEEKDIVRGLSLGADDYVVKPFSPTEFAARVHRLIARGRPAAAA